MSWARQRDHAELLYILGYRRAAELVQAEVERRGSERLVFPLLFLWRQHIELFVKSLIGLGQRVHELEAVPARGHVLPRLWAELHGLLKLEEESEGLADAIAATEQIIKDLEAADPNSTHSRYAEGHSGVHGSMIASLRELPDHFDPKHFGKVLAGVSDFFDCIHTEYMNRLDALAEMAAAMSDP